MAFTTPSGTVKFDVREETFRDRRLRSRLIARAKWTWEPEGGISEQREWSRDDLMIHEIMLVIKEITVKTDGKWEAAPITEADGRYVEAELESFIEDLDPDDVLFMHQKVIEVNPRWASTVPQ